MDKRAHFKHNEDKSAIRGTIKEYVCVFFFALIVNICLVIHTYEDSSLSVHFALCVFLYLHVCNRHTCKMANADSLRQIKIFIEGVDKGLVPETCYTTPPCPRQAVGPDTNDGHAGTALLALLLQATPTPASPGHWPGPEGSRPPPPCPPPEYLA